MAVLAVLLLGSAPAAAQLVRGGDDVAFSAASPHPYPMGAGKAPAWSVTISHPDASYVTVHFDRFELAPGDRVVVRSPDGGRRHVYTGRGKADLGRFWSAQVPGDIAIVELMSPAPGAGAWGVSIDKYGAGYPDFQATEGPEALCGVDDKDNAICFNDGSATVPDDPIVYDGSRAVARLIIAGNFLCTGWLVGCEGHLITNNHCFDDPALPDPAIAAATADYEFMLEAPTCGVPCFNCTGTIWGGTATLETRDDLQDYAIVRLSGNPQNTYGSFELANRQPVLDERIWIPQHAGGRPKEIAVSSSDPNDASGFCEIFSNNEPGCTNIGTEVGYFCDTEGGSSGSPVIATSDNKVVSLHHCANCPNRGLRIPDLVADMGGVGFMPACSIFDTNAHVSYYSHTFDDSLGNNDGIVDPGEPVAFIPTLRNVGAAGATAISATLTTSTPGVTIVDPLADFPDAASTAMATAQAPFFAVQVGSSVPCGTMIQFTLTVNTAQGVYVSTFEQVVGLATTTGTFPFNSTDTPLAIFDLTTTTSTLNIPVGMIIDDLNLSVDISHTYRGDLFIELLSPDGTWVNLKTVDGTDSAPNVVTTYDTLTEPALGEMDSYDGKSITGAWQLFVTDVFNGDTGTINGWSVLADDRVYSCSAVAVPSGAVPDGTLTVAPSAAPGDLDLAWGGSCAPADTDYEVYEGTLGSFTSHTQSTCSTGGATGWTLTPSAGSAYYLVVPRNATSEGSYGTDSSGGERGQGLSACMTQLTGACP